MLHQNPEGGATALASPCAEAGTIELRGSGGVVPVATSGKVHGCLPPPSREAVIPLPKRAGWPGPSSGPAKRRVFTAEEKARIVAESFESGKSVCSVARQHRLMASQLFAWRRSTKLRREAERVAILGAIEPAARTASEPCGSSPPMPAKQASPIEISIGTAIVRVQKGADPATLKEVLRALCENS